MSSSDRKPWASATSLTQSLLDFCQDNLECRLEMVCEIETPAGTIYASDRNKYVGGTFYEALLNFPLIGRTVGEWLSNDLQFSTLTLELSNVDGRFNNLVPGGADYESWIGKDVVVKLGLAEQASTYTTIFKGKVTDVGGFKRSVRSIIVIARDDYEKSQTQFPQTTFTQGAYPKIESKNIGKIVPVIYGDWTVATEPNPASVPAFCTNGGDGAVSVKDRPVDISGPATPAVFTLADHGFDVDDPIVLATSASLPTPFIAGTTYWVKTVIDTDNFTVAATMGGSAINSTSTGSGEHTVKFDDASAARRDPEFRVSENDLLTFDQASVYLKRGDVYLNVPTSELTMLGGGNKAFSVAQKSGSTWVDGAEYEFDQADTFWVKVIGKDLGSWTHNIVEQARDLLLTYGNLISGDFDTSWNTYRAKSTPTQSAIVNIKSRIWLGEQQNTLTYVLSMLEQVRLEAFVDRNLKVKINSLHFEDWDPAPTYPIKNWDVARGTFQCSTLELNNFNAAQGVYNYLPDANQNAYTTTIYKNAAAITQMGKRIAKKLVFPNLYELETVTAQVVEVLRLASCSFETITAGLTWRSALLDIGDFVLLKVQIGATIFDSVPAMVREIGHDPDGLKTQVKLWALGMVPYPSYTPGYSGTVGGYSATIVEET